MINDVGERSGTRPTLSRAAHPGGRAPAPTVCKRPGESVVICSQFLPSDGDPGDGDSRPLDAVPLDPVLAGPERFVSLFLENERRIQAFIFCLLPNLADADDVLQETSLILWQKFGQFQPGTDFLAWACRIAQFRVMKFYEQRGRSRLRYDAQAMDAVAVEALRMEPLLDARHHALAQCLESLNPRDRDLLQRRYAQDCSPQQVAVQVGRSVDAVYKALSRIHGTLMSCIQHRLARE